MRRKSEILKDLRVHGKGCRTSEGRTIPARVTGKNCLCIKKCFQRTGPNNRQDLFTQFYEMEDKDERDRHLCGLIETCSVRRGRPRTTEEPDRKSKPGCYSHKGKQHEVCQVAFLNIRGITPSRFRRPQASLVILGKSPRDLRRSTHQSGVAHDMTATWQ